MPDLGDGDRFRTLTRVPGIESHDTPDGLVLYDPKADAVHHLNAMSTLIYELCDGRPIESIAASMEVVFNLERPEASELAGIGIADLRRIGVLD